ncbi:hypothetical protein MCHI_002736 [Candidatus Magnetoovum chiemensis]|nr:hypothetical protein MCHI_002736 [Candidatus Magnetoovum chiemensis]
MSIINIIKLTLYYLYNLIPWTNKISVKDLKQAHSILIRIFRPKDIKITKNKIFARSGPINAVEIRIANETIEVYGGITLNNRIVLLKNNTLTIYKIGEKTLYDGTLWVENSLFYGKIENLVALNVSSGGVIKSNGNTFDTLYIRDGCFNGSIRKINKWVHLAHPYSLLIGNIEEIGETLFIDNGTFYTDKLPIIKGGYILIKDGYVKKLDATPWDCTDLLKQIRDLKTDQEIFLFGSDSSVFLGAKASSLIIKEGVDTYSRHKTENILNTNKFYRLINGKVKEVTLRISNNQNISIPSGKFYTFVRLNIIEDE